jgi:hypothetical protein
MGINGESSMITQDKFYSKEDHPTSESRTRMWNNINRELPKRKGSFLHIMDKRSFIYGIAASFILYFTALGVVGTIKQTIEQSQPQVVKVDNAYQSAIREFEKIAPQVKYTAAANRTGQDYASVRKDQLDNLDATIESLRKETPSGDLSPLLQTRLRQLYSMKLQILQDMIENGEITL